MVERHAQRLRIRTRLRASAPAALAARDTAFEHLFRDGFLLCFSCGYGIITTCGISV